MASTVPAPVLDLANEDVIAAEAIAGLPAELSDRSNSNPAVVLIEAFAWIYGRLSFQIGQWPQALVQKLLALLGVTLNPAAAATCQQQFTLSAPQPSDTPIASGTQVATVDGTIVFQTTQPVSAKGYKTPAGTVTLTAGSTTVTGSGTAFTTEARGNDSNGNASTYQIRPTGAGYWLTVASVTNDTTLVLVSSAPATVTSTAYDAGQITAITSAQATSTGSVTNVGAGALTSLQSSPAFVASTTNLVSATGGADLESAASAIARAPSVFASRDMICSGDDAAYFAQQVLGSGGRAVAKATTNVNTTQPGFFSCAMLSPLWTLSQPVSSTERAAVVRDASGRLFSGATYIDVVASLYSLTPAVCVVRRASFDPATVQANVAAKLNAWLNPSTYSWGKVIYVEELVAVAASATGVDHVFAANGVAACSTGYHAATPATVTFTTGSPTATTANTASFAAGQTWLIDAVGGAAYLVTAISPGVSVTLDRNFTGATSTATRPYFTAADDDQNGGTSNPPWYSLPFASLAAPYSSIVVVGSL